MIDILNMVREWLTQDGFKAEKQCYNFPGPTKIFSSLMVWTPHHSMDISITRCHKREECVEIWVGGDHMAGMIEEKPWHSGNPLWYRYKYHSILAWRISLYDPESLQRISEIVRDPYVKAGDHVIKNKYGPSGKIK